MTDQSRSENSQAGSWEKSSRDNNRAKLGDYFIGVVCIVAWMAIFTAGLSIDAKQYRENLATVFSLTDLVAVAFVYTYTNVAFLTCLAGAVGGVSSRLTLRSYYDISGLNLHHLATTIGKGSASYRWESPIASVCRSFAVYLFYIAGLAIGIPGTHDGNTTVEQYMRMAGLLSALGFLVGYDPTIFTSMLQKFSASQALQAHDTDKKA